MAKAEDTTSGRGKARRARPDPEPSTVAVWSSDNKQVREVTVSGEVFGAPVNEHLLYEAVKHQRAGARRGTHKTKNRAEVSGSGRKPWRQKGTGRARVGDIRTPLWRHGGTVFGPTPRDYSYHMPKKARAGALRSALAQRLREGALKVVEDFPVEPPSPGERPRLTRQMKIILERLDVQGKVVLVEHEPSDALVLSGRNLPSVKVVADSYLTTYDVLDCKTLLLSQVALEKLEERLTP
jgi:large subunit ribosomal protein L4